MRHFVTRARLKEKCSRWYSIRKQLNKGRRSHSPHLWFKASHHCKNETILFMWTGQSVSHHILIWPLPDWLNLMTTCVVYWDTVNPTNNTQAKPQYSTGAIITWIYNSHPHSDSSTQNSKKLLNSKWHSNDVSWTQSHPQSIQTSTHKYKQSEKRSMQMTCLVTFACQNHMGVQLMWCLHLWDHNVHTRMRHAICSELCGTSDTDLVLMWYFERFSIYNVYINVYSEGYKSAQQLFLQLEKCKIYFSHFYTTPPPSSSE